MGDVSFIDKTIKQVKQHLNNTYMTILFTKNSVSIFRCQEVSQSELDNGVSSFKTCC